MVVRITQHIEAPNYVELPQAPTMPQQNNQKHQVESTACPMDIDIQNAQINTKKQLPSCDNQGCPQRFLTAITTTMLINIVGNSQLPNIINTYKSTWSIQYPLLVYTKT